MKFCSNCGTKFEADAKFCSECGAERSQSTEMDEDDAVHSGGFEEPETQGLEASDDNLKDETTTIYSDEDDDADVPVEVLNAGTDNSGGGSGGGKFITLIICLAIGAVVYFNFFQGPSEKELWDIASQENTVASYETFLESFPNAEYASRARSSINDIRSQEAAKLALDDEAFAAAANDTRIRAYASYIDEYPNGKHVDKAIEGAWESALRQDNTRAYEVFLYEFWNTSYREEMNTRLVSSYKNTVKEYAARAQEIIKQAAVYKREAARRVQNGNTGCISRKCSGGVGIWVSREDGSKFEGEFNQEGDLHGDSVFISYADGDYFVGDYRNNRRNGEANAKYADGAAFFGYYKDGERSGNAVYIWPDGSWYSGDYVKGSRNDDNAIEVFPSGDRYIGNYVDGSWSGTGRYIWADGRMYDGDFVDGEFHGEGKFFSSNGELRYFGKWNNGKRTDEGAGSLIGTLAAGAYKIANDALSEDGKSGKKKKRKKK